MSIEDMFQQENEILFNLYNRQFTDLGNKRHYMNSHLPYRD